MNLMGLPLNRAIKLIHEKSLEYELIETGNDNNKYHNIGLEISLNDTREMENYRVVKVDFGDDRYVLTVVKK